MPALNIYITKSDAAALREAGPAAKSEAAEKARRAIRAYLRRMAAGQNK